MQRKITLVHTECMLRVYLTEHVLIQYLNLQKTNDYFEHKDISLSQG
jgi:hypothetical protein